MRKVAGGNDALTFRCDAGSWPTGVAVVTVGVHFGTRFDHAHRLVDFLSVCGDYNRQIGQTRQWIVESLAVFDITPDEVPAGIKF